MRLDGSLGPACASDFALDRLRAGELTGRPEEAQLTAHLEACERCRERASTLAATPPPERVLGRLLREQRRRQARATGLFAGGAVLVAALLIFVVAVPSQSPTPMERMKGQAAAFELEVRLRHADGSGERLLEGGVARPGETLTFHLLANRDGFVGIFGLDQAGIVTPYAPVGGERLAAVARGPERLLPNGVELDATLGAERLVALFCDRALLVAEVSAKAGAALAAARGDPQKVAAFDLPGCAEATLLMEKRPAE